MKKRTLAERLAELMSEKDYRAPRGSHLGFDAKKLAAIGQARSIESARKWLQGSSEPRGRRLQAIAGHFGVTMTWLRDEEGRKYDWEQKAEEDHPIYSGQFLDEWKQLPSEIQDHFLKLMSAFNRKEKI